MDLLDQATRIEIEIEDPFIFDESKQCQPIIEIILPLLMHDALIDTSKNSFQYCEMLFKNWFNNEKGILNYREKKSKKNFNYRKKVDLSKKKSLYRKKSRFIEKKVALSKKKSIYRRKNEILSKKKCVVRQDTTYYSLYMNNRNTFDRPVEVLTARFNR